MMHGWAPNQVNVVKMLKSVVSGKRKLFGAELGTIGNQPTKPTRNTVELFAGSPA